MAVLHIPKLAWAQQEDATAQPKPAQHWGVSLGYGQYSEETMSLAGSNIGLHTQWRHPFDLSQWTIQAQALVGAPNYTSTVSGNLDRRKTWETAWRVLYEHPDKLPWGLNGQLQTGLELQSYYNDLRGLTSNGHAGYERERLGLWAVAGYQKSLSHPQAFGLQGWNLEVALLLKGVAVSRLSQVSSAYTDTKNQQNHGFSLRAERRYRSDWGDFVPYISMTKLKDSERQNSGAVSVIEPSSTHLQLGVKWFWR